MKDEGEMIGVYLWIEEGKLDSRYFYSILIQFLTEKIEQIIKVHQISQNIEERDIISCDGKESRIWSE